MSQILIVDDDDFRAYLKDVLSDLGHEVFQASNGKEGLREYVQNSSNIDAVISDVVMPEGDGVDFFKALKDINSRLKVIVISGGGIAVSADKYLRMCEMMGATAVLKKPFTRDQLKAALVS